MKIYESVRVTIHRRERWERRGNAKSYY